MDWLRISKSSCLGQDPGSFVFDATHHTEFTDSPGSERSGHGGQAKLEEGGTGGHGWAKSTRIDGLGPGAQNHSNNTHKAASSQESSRTQFVVWCGAMRCVL